jgi:endoglucanase
MSGLRDKMRMISRRGVALTTALVSVSATAGLALVTPAAAAPGCRVDYTVPSQWSGGFTGNVAVTNTGDRVNGWRLTWTWPSGQRVTQAWNATVTSSGNQVTATDSGYNAVIEPNGTVSLGFGGS